MFKTQNLFYLLLLKHFCVSVQINYIKVPPAVRNNSGHSAVLDCNFSFRSDDANLVVKWLLNDQLVYLWKQPQKPEAFGILKGRVDLSYQASRDHKTAYRAIKILNPTAEVAGEYKCFVSTFADEDFSARNMTVFEPESSLIVHKSEIENAKVNFTCSAHNVYPEPKLFLFKAKTETELKLTPLQAIEWNTIRHPSGKYSVFIIGSSNLTDVLPSSLVHCELRIPGTGYIKKTAFLFYPYSDGHDYSTVERFSWTLLLLFSFMHAVCLHLYHV